MLYGNVVDGVNCLFLIVTDVNMSENIEEKYVRGENGLQWGEKDPIIAKSGLNESISVLNEVCEAELSLEQQENSTELRVRVNANSINAHNGVSETCVNGTPGLARQPQTQTDSLENKTSNVGNGITRTDNDIVQRETFPTLSATPKHVMIADAHLPASPSRSIKSVDEDLPTYLPVRSKRGMEFGSEKLITDEVLQLKHYVTCTLHRL